MKVLHFFRKPVLGIRDPCVKNSEYCFNVEVSEPLTPEELKILTWLLKETFEPQDLSKKSFLPGKVIELGPRLNFETAYSTNAVSICHACGLKKVTRVERSRRYNLRRGSDSSSFITTNHDRMTEMSCLKPIKTFETGLKPKPVSIIPLIEEGKSALEKINREMGLGMDAWDIDYYYNLFVNNIGRNPTDVECFQLAQANSEHSRHWFFKGNLVINGKKAPHCLLEIVRQTLESNPNNSVIAFSDNSSAIKGYNVWTIIPLDPRKPSPFHKGKFVYHLVFTAETHNYPSGVEPFAGAETGTGGRERDNSDTGKGAYIIAGSAAYCVGNLLIPGYNLPWEDRSFVYPPELASSLNIEIRASDGASDYGNKFGEPVIIGFTRSFGLRLPDGERREWIKPIMFTGGIGQMDARHIEKGKPKKGMLLVKIGGPAYRIGVGGGAASSMIQGENIPELDFNAVQRGNPEMAKKTYNVIRAGVEMGRRNPFVTIHDQGAGGRCNVETEIVNPAGAKIKVRKVLIGDQSMSVLEIWGAEFQEQHAILIWKNRIRELKEICRREKVYCAIVGEITGDGYLVLYDEKSRSTPVNLELSKILGKLPRKTFYSERIPAKLEPLKLPNGLTVGDALKRVLRLLSVGSKRFLTTKVDRSVTGLIAQQQCVGPLQITLSDYAVITQSHLGLTGAATSIGEQPIKGLINPKTMARMSVGEAVTNLAGVLISALKDVRCSANWMWAPKLPGEGANIYDAACAMRDMMIKLGMAVDGGKDSIFMAAKVTDSKGKTEIVKSPGELVISAYVTCPDITKKVTPEIKRPGESKLLYLDLGNGKYRLGGSALAQVYKQIGDESPDVENPRLLKHAFQAIQQLVKKNLILAYHDRSDGGLITTLLEMAFAGNSGLIIDLNGLKDNGLIKTLFSEELGMIVEYLPKNEETIRKILSGLNPMVIGETTIIKEIVVVQNGKFALKENMKVLRNIWEETSSQLDCLQANPKVVKEERKTNFSRQGPSFRLTFNPQPTPKEWINAKRKPKAFVIREEGTNGDREMASAFYLTGFEVWDITMTDLLSGRITLDKADIVVFPGGFTYADVLDAAKGWAGTIKFNPRLKEEFDKFYHRPDTLSLGVCNGCQLMALLGWVPWFGLPNKKQPRFIRNTSWRFESRFPTVKILPSPAIMLRGMENSVLGIWVAHGEGSFFPPDKKIFSEILKENLAPIRFIDDDGCPTETYPLNPNGSPLGITALCSPDGRHLALMPHPERTFLLWQWPYLPEKWKNLKASPWLKLFQNAREWCEKF